MTRERLAKAKSVSIYSFLKGIGIEPDMTTGTAWVYNSPLRSESKASFNVSKKTNKYIDFGTNKHGDIIDLVMAYYNKSMGEAIDIILGEHSRPENTFIPEKQVKNAIEIVSMEELHSKYLLDYLTERRINLCTARTYLQEAKIRFPMSKTNPDREHLVVAFKNDSGGYEFRNRYRKVSSSPKNIRTVKGVFDNNCVELYESWPDFLSFLTHFGYEQPECNAIILNSISFLGAIIPMLKGKLVKYYGQRDLSGDRAYRRLRAEGIAVNDKRLIFRGHKDFNEYIIASSNSKLSKIFI